MIGGYTPCPAQRPYPGYSNGYEYMTYPCDARPYYHPLSRPELNSFYHEPTHKPNDEFSYSHYSHTPKGNIYQMSPYLNF